MDPNQPQSNPAVFEEFMKKFSEGKTEEEVGKMLAALFQFQSEALFEVMTQVLTEEDMKAIEQIADESAAEEEIIRRFQTRAGIPPQEFVNQLRDRVSDTYLKKDNPSAE